MSTIVVNCRKVPFASTLGVAHFLLRACEQLSDDHELVFVVPDIDEFDRSSAADVVRPMASEVVSPDDQTLRSPRTRSHSVELLPHHFQGPDFCDDSIVVCHDLHVFDIPWKYGDRAAHMQNTFRQVLSAASAVVTEFPRTYYEVERVAGLVLPSLFLTPTPLLLDTRPSADIAPPSDNEHFTLMYPAQLQAHKNHISLIESVGRLRNAGRPLRLVLPGTEFASDGRDAVLESIRSCGVEEHVDLVGRLDDDALVALYGAVDAVIVPSAAEGGAYVPLEAIGAGRPVAVNRIDSAVRHLEAMRGEVIWFDADDPISLDEAIVALTELDRSQFVESNAECRRQIEAATWSGVARVFDAIVRMLTGQRARPRLRVDRKASSIEYA